MALNVGDAVVELENSAVWRRFSSFRTEMIITKSGRYERTRFILIMHIMHAGRITNRLRKSLFK